MRTLNEGIREPIYLSVILSTYNDEKYIAESIQSILDQSYPYFELIIVNDGSTDSTYDIIKQFSDPRIIIINKKNTGLPDSLNVGIKISKYDWIARMDGDDISNPYRFEEQINYIRENIAIISSQGILIDTDGNSIGITKFGTSKIGVKISLLLNLPLIIHPAVIFNKKFYYEVGGYDTNMTVAQDYDLWCKMQSKGDVVVSSKYLIKLRKHSNNISSNRQKMQSFNSLISYIKKNHKINRNLLPEEYLKLSNCVNASFWFKRYYFKKHSSKATYLISRIGWYIYVNCSLRINNCVRILKNNSTSVT